MSYMALTLSSSFASEICRLFNSLACSLAIFRYEVSIGRVILQWVKTAWNRRIHFTRHKPLMSSGASEGASERTNERSGARERSEQLGASEWVSGASERASGRANGPVLYASISYHFNPQRAEPRAEVAEWHLFPSSEAKCQTANVSQCYFHMQFFTGFP